jgi:sulfur-oxidizing protein SoxX
LLGWFVVLGAVPGCASAPPDVRVPYRVEGDAIPQSLARVAGDAARGREILAGRDGNCLLCHAAPESGARFMGNLASPLSGVGARLSAGQLRLRIVDSSLVNRETIMPAYYRVRGLNRVAEAYRGRPILTEQQVEDTVAYLLTLR